MSYKITIKQVVAEQHYKTETRTTATANKTTTK